MVNNYSQMSTVKVWKEKHHFLSQRVYVASIQEKVIHGRLILREESFLSLHRGRTLPVAKSGMRVRRNEETKMECGHVDVRGECVKKEGERF